MVASAEQYAVIDKENRKNIDLKNNAEALCYEANKQLLLVKDSISEDTQDVIIKLIENIKVNTKSNNFEFLEPQIEELKMLMKDLLDVNPIKDNDIKTDNPSNLNDI